MEMRAEKLQSLCVILFLDVVLLQQNSHGRWLPNLDATVIGINYLVKIVNMVGGKTLQILPSLKHDKFVFLSRLKVVF